MVRTCIKQRLVAVRTSHIQNASILFLGRGSSYLFAGSASWAHSPFFTRTTKLYARHRIEFCHIGDKVHIICTDGAHAHDALGDKVDHGEKHDREVVGHERGRGPVTPEEHFPSTELEEISSRRKRRGTGVGVSQFSRDTQE